MHLPAGEVRLPWSQVRQVRLCYAPTELKAWRHVFTVDGSGGVSISFDNGHYVSVGEFENRSAAFLASVVAVLQKVSEHAAAARLCLGSPPLSYAALLAAAAVPMAILCWMILPVPSTILGVELNIVGRLLIMAAMLPLVGLWIGESPTTNRRHGIATRKLALRAPERDGSAPPGCNPK